MEHFPAYVVKSDAEALEIAESLASEFKKDAVRRDAERILPWAELDRFSASGLWGMTVPKDNGGAAVSTVTLAKVIALIASADGSLAQIPQNHFYALEVIRSGATPDQRRYFETLALQGYRFGNALAEIGAKDFKRRTRLYKEGEQLFVTGQKFYCTGALYAHFIPTLVVDEAGVQHLVVIPGGAKGVTITDDWDGFGQRVTGSGSVSFEKVAVEEDWIVPFQASFERPTPIGPHAQLMHAAIDLGIGQGALVDLLPFVQNRARPWIDSGVDHAAKDPLTIQAVGEITQRLAEAEALLIRAGRAVDQAIAHADEDSVAEASLAVAAARALTTTAGLYASSKAVELAGTSATDRSEGNDRHWRNVRTHSLHDPVRWKYHAIGNHRLNDILPPRHGAI